VIFQSANSERGALAPRLHFGEREIHHGGSIMTTPPTDPRAEVRKQLMSALIWTVLAAAIAVLLFLQAMTPGNDKKNFYIIAGIIAVIAAAANGYAAWNLFQKSKTPPAA
jgi:hypothetical protein